MVHSLMNAPMIRFLFFILLIVSIMNQIGFLTLYADSDSMSSTGYRVNLSLIDPLRSDHGNQDPSSNDGSSSLRWLLETISNLLLWAMMILAGIG